MSRTNYEDHPLTPEIITLLQRLRTSEDSPMTDNAIAGYLGVFNGPPPELSGLLAWLAKEGVIGVIGLYYSGSEEPYYYFLDPLERLAREAEDSG